MSKFKLCVGGYIMRGEATKSRRTGETKSNLSVVALVSASTQNSSL